MGNLTRLQRHSPKENSRENLILNLKEQDQQNNAEKLKTVTDRIWQWTFRTAQSVTAALRCFYAVVGEDEENEY